MKKTIQAVTQAFSMQPATFRVNETISVNPEKKIARIELENERSGDECFEVIVGYDSNDNILFEFLRTSVNIFYY